MLESLAAIFAPHRCLNCSREGSMLCGECRESVPRHPEICFSCNRISPGSLTCANCRRQMPLMSVKIVASYEGAIAEVIKALKFGRARDGAKPLGQLIAPFVRLSSYDLVVPVPSASSRARLRGYNPADLIAEAAVAETGLLLERALGRLGQKRQVGTKRQDRLRQLAEAFYVLSADRKVRGKAILLIDDVLTTGATISECAKALRRSGAKSVDAIVVARHNT